MARTFRLLHISDLHITRASLHGTWSREFIQAHGPGDLASLFSRPASEARLLAVAEAAFGLRPLDAVVITGDLANRGDGDSLEAALTVVMSPAESGPTDRSGRPTLQGAEAPIWLLPGNHDRYDQLAGAVGAGGRLFDRVFRDYWGVGQGAASVTLGEELGIVFGDLTLARSADAEGPGGAWGQGCAYPERTAFMEIETQLLRTLHPQIAVLWAVHFAPRFEGLPSNLRLLDEDRLLAAAERQGIRHILCGHTHEPRYYTPQGSSVAVLCTGSAAQRGPHPNTIHLIEVDVAAGAVARFEPKALRFVPKEGTFLPDT